MGVLEECVGIDGKVLQEVLIPMMSISRRCLDGTKQPDETLNKGELYITTAGYKNSFPYNKLIQVLVKMITDPGTAFVLGGTYKVPVLLGQYEKTFVQDQKKDETFNEAAFGREYRTFVLFKLLRIAGNSLEPLKPQHKYEIKLSVMVKN